jgi:hypothetical protein
MLGDIDLPSYTMAAPKRLDAANCVGALDFRTFNRQERCAVVMLSVMLRGLDAACRMNFPGPRLRRDKAASRSRLAGADAPHAR